MEESVQEARSKGRPSLEEAASIDRAIRDAALHELLEKGEAASLNAVAKAAGLSRKTVYARYSNKTDLFVDAVREVLGNAGPITFDLSGSLEQRLSSYVLEALAVLARPHAQAFRKALSMNPGSMAELRDELIEASHAMFHAPLSAMLADAQARGELADNTDREECARLIMVMTLLGTEIRADPSEDARDNARHARFLAALIVNGIGRPAAPQ
ncbi:TetR family transcriptional regulator [Novosphingobium sp. PhB165]|uniref:TetR/AcrR family transcriptional regulator n=1 Tax=Novosphingobium sp. PhB165 TaxID=2485105 RepID=UPI0010496ACE|nr:TetR/AcrR family transcriptional regulator [Novosphingobium sp. PhB165]TCM20905.1 TetR family transcriptional regulator [Novosphingobium sp. PhB165]